MPEITSYSAGTFSWADLTSPDQPASKAFYAALFGWGAVDNPIGDGVVYSQMLLRGKPVVAIAPNMPDQSDTPASWGAYVTVESADAAVEKARSLGATVGGDGAAFDVFDVGRMAFLSDPQGSAFRVWEPRAHIGAEIVREPGSLAWFELSSPDPAAVAPFYAELFAWTVSGTPGMEDYLMATTSAGEGTGAINAAGDTATGWLVYFWADNVDATLATATEHGAEVLVPATDIPGGMGRFAVLRDPQGAEFGLFKA